MRDLFELVDTPKYTGRMQKHMSQLKSLAYDTIVHATAGTHSPDDYSKVCYDAYREVTASIRETFSMIRRDYSQEQDISDVILSSKDDFQKHILPKWKEMSTHVEQCIPQLFQDATAAHIYNYQAAMEVLYLLQKMCTLFLESKSLNKVEKSKLMGDIYNKCLAYSKDSLFIDSAGKPLKTLGYTDMSTIYDVSNGYGHIVEALDNSTILDMLGTYKKDISYLENQASTLDSLMEERIAKAEAIDDTTLHQYQDIFTKAKAVATVHRLSVAMAGLISFMRKTVDNITDAAYRSQTGEILTNVTEDMGGPLIPTLIETQSVATEGFLGKILNRIKTSWNDNKLGSLQKYRSLAPFMDFIHEHVSSDAVANYLKTKKWKSIPYSQIADNAKTIHDVFFKQEKFCNKFSNATTFQDAFPYPDNKLLNVPEIVELHKTLEKVGIAATISYQDRYTRSFNPGTSPDQTKNLLSDDNFRVCVMYKNMATPDLSTYLEDQNKLVKVKLLTGVQMGLKEVNDLDQLQALGEEHGAILENDVLTFSPTNRDMDKNTSAIHDPKYRDNTIVNFYRGLIWYDYWWYLFDVYAWCIYMCYDVIKDVKKYA